MPSSLTSESALSNRFQTCLTAVALRSYLQDAFLSADGCTLLLSSNQSGSFDIYVARKPPR